MFVLAAIHHALSGDSLNYTAVATSIMRLFIGLREELTSLLCSF